MSAAMWRWLLLAAAVVFVGGCGDEESAEDAYTDRNEDLLEELPEFPQSELIAVAITPYFDEGEQEAAGYTTNAIYAVPAGTTADQIVEYFVAELGGGWQVRQEDPPAVDLTTGETRESVPLAHFIRGDEAVSVNTDNVAAEEPRFELVVDHKGG